MTAAERRHIEQVKGLACLVCEVMGLPAAPPTDAHHITQGGRRVSHYAVLPLCRPHHEGPDGIHTLHESGFEHRYKLTNLKMLAMVTERLAK